MPHGKADPFLVGVRQAIAGQKGFAAPAVPAGLSGITWNHTLPLLIGRWFVGAQGARAALLAFLGMGQSLGHCAAGGNVPELGGKIGLRVEILSNSHAAHDYAAVCSGLLLAMRAGDAEVLAAFVLWLTGEMALLNLCAGPKWPVVAGARCFLGPMATPQQPNAGGDADQRAQMGGLRAYLIGAHMHMPATLQAADDELGLYSLTLIDAAHKKGEAWADGWPDLRKALAGAGPDQLPLTYEPLSIERSQHGHVIRQLGVTGQIRPSLWACSNYATGEETYGCLPSWPKEYKPKIGEIPAPPCPGGPGKVFQTKGAQHAA